MSAEVGGRLETVEPHRSLFGPDYTRLLALLAIAAAIHAWLVCHTAVPARDSLGYTRIALNLSNPVPDNDGKERQRIDIIRTAVQPPGYPLAICGVEKVLAMFVDLPLADRSLLAAQVANALAAVLLVVPMYLIGRILFGRNVGFAAALLFQVMPVPARMTSDGLSEGLYLLIVGIAIVFAVRSLRQPTIGGFLICGVATGVSYLVRPEGLGVAIAATAVALYSGCTRRWPRDQALGRICALGIGVALVAVPYMMLIGKLTNKPTGIDLLNPLDSQRVPYWQGQPLDSRLKDQPAPGAALFATWWDPARDAGRNREIWALEAVWSELIKSLHYVMGGLALIGLLAHRRQLFSPDLAMWFILGLAMLNAALMVYLAERICYVSERHTLLFVMLTCLLAAAALEPLARGFSSMPYLGRLVIWPQAAPGGILLALVISTLPFTLQPMHVQREGHKHAGRWLATQIADGDWLIDPLCWAEWYAGRTLYNTVAYRGGRKATWVVVEEGKREDKANPHSRIPQWDLAMKEKERGVLVYKWPEHPNSKVPTVCVYKIEAEQPRPTPSQIGVAPAPREKTRAEKE